MTQITEAMIEAGAHAFALMHQDSCYPDACDWKNGEAAKAIYLAMNATKPVEGDAVLRVARALCKVTGANPDALGVDGKPRWFGWVQYAKPAIAALASPPPVNDEVIEQAFREGHAAGMRLTGRTGSEDADWQDSDARLLALAKSSIVNEETSDAE